MKKELLLSLSIIMMLLVVPFTVEAQRVYMSDGFENGFNPTGDALKTTMWTQEYYDVSQSGWVSEAPQNSQSWKTETTGLYYPDGAVKSRGRAFFRNEPDANGAVQTAGYRTRLITPVIDLSSGYQPILRFYHAQAKYTGDFDTLRVYYRTGEGLQWNVLAEYKTYINKWKFEEISLPAVGEWYQIAFEASENIGRGIVLDSVIVRTRPQITTPHDLTFSDMRDNGITIQWQASMDADYFQVALTKSPNFDFNIDPDMINDEEVIVNEKVDGEQLQLRVDSLDPGATYYVQIRSIGETENSVWCDVYSFRMKVTKPVPYFENFNTSTAQEGSTILRDNQLETWVYGGDYQPEVPIYLQPAGNKIISYDGTYALAFVKFGKYNATSAFNVTDAYLPAGSTSYTASPEISSTKEGFHLNQCHVTFWGTIAQATGNYARSIIVGVMTDPEDLTTFVPVDTCTMWAYKTFQYFDISLASYVGDGRYVAFLSNFEKSNQFFIDDFTVEELPAVGTVLLPSIKVLPDTTNAIVTWDAVAGATTYNVKYQKLENKGDATPILATAITADAQSVTTNTITLTGLVTNAKYIVSIQADGGKWSQPKAFYTSASIVIDDTHEKYYSFEEDEGSFTMSGTDNTANKYPQDFMIFSNDPEHPYMYSSNFRTGKNSIGLTKDVGCDAWVVAPMVDDLKAVEVQFYTMTSTAGKLQVGVMTHPDDITTFVPIEEFTATANYAKRYVNFLTYNGTGKYIAFRWVEVDGITKSNNFIDDLTIRVLGSCLPVTGLSVTPTDSSAVVTWNKGSATEWEIKVSSSAILDSELNTKDGDVLKATKVTDNTTTIDSLRWAYNYYVYVRTVCDGTTNSDWVGKAFSTDCPAKLPIPYIENFERYETGSGHLPSCWGAAYPYSSTTYPHVYSSSSYANNGSQCLYLYSNATSGGYAVLPELSIPLSDAMARFYARGGTSTSTKYILYVGVMTDPSDGDTFTVVDSLTMSGATYTQYSVFFDKYTGNGKYIAFSSNIGTTNYIYMDDLEVLSVIDGAPANFVAKEATENSITAQWEGKTTGEWQVIVSSKYYALKDQKDVAFDPMTIPAEEVVAKGTVSTAEFKAEGLSVMTEYYFYIKSTKGTEWGLGTLMTACESLNPRVKKTEGFEIGKTVIASLNASEANLGYFQNAQVPTCWTVGNAKYGTDLSAATTYTVRGYFPFICSNGTGTTTTTNYYDKGTATKTYAYSSAGYNSLKLYGYYSSTASSNCAPAWAAMPYLDCEDADLPLIVISGQLQMSASYALLVGVMDDPEDLSTFVVLDSITGGKGTGRGSNGTTNNVVNFEVTLENYTGKGHYIAFRTQIGKTATIYLDEITVSLATCAAPHPSFSQITDNSARLYSGLRIDNAWKYYLSAKPFDTKAMDAGTMPDSADIIDSLIVGDGSQPVPYAPLEGLEADSTYYVALATICDETTSVWRSASVKTLCQNIDVETFKEDFESKGYSTTAGSPIGCWIIGNNTATASTSYKPSIVNHTYSQTGSRMMKLQDNKNYGSGCYAVLPGLAFPEGKSIKDYQISMTVAATSYAAKLSYSPTENGTLIVGITTDPNNLSAMEVIDTIVYTTATLERLVLPLDTYTGTGNFIVLLSQAIDKTASWLYVDDVTLESIPSCRHASHIEIDTLTQTSVTLTWEGESDKYNIAIATEKYVDSVKIDTLVDSNSDVLLQQVTGHSATITGLKANTNYYAYVQAVCSDTEQSVWSYEARHFRTDCPDLATIPWFDDFDDEHYATGSGNMGCCYRGEYLTGTTLSNAYPQIQTTATYSYEKQSMKLYGTTSNTTVFVSPELDIESLSELQLSFYAGKTADKILYIGTIDSVEAMYRTFVPFDSITLTASMDQYFINLDTVKLGTRADKKHIAFMANSKTGTVYIDDLRIRYIPTCYEPLDIAISEIQTTQAVLTFTPFYETDAKWDVRLKDVDAATEKTYTLTDTTFLFTGLKPATNYAVRVRTNCGEDYSEWTAEKTFGTKWIIDSTYTFTFKKDEQGTTSVLSPKATSTYIHPALTGLSGSKATSTYYPYYVANTTAYAYALNPEGDIKENSLKLQVQTTYDSATLVLPLIKDPEQKQISFYLRAGVAYVSDYSTESNRNVVYTVYKDAYLTVGTIDTLGNFESFKPYTTIKPSQLVKNDTLRKADNYGWDKYTISLADMNVNDRQVAFMMKCHHKCSATIYMGQLSIEKLTGVTTPIITDVVPLDTTVTISWTGNAAAYNIYLIDTLKTKEVLNFIPYLNSAADTLVTKIENVTGNTYTIKGLKETETYAVYVQDAAHVSDQAALSNRIIFNTVCAIKEGNGYSYDFEPGPNYKSGKNPSLSVADGFTYQWPTSTTAGDTIYRTPDCWQVGIDKDNYDITSTTYKSYNPTMFPNTSTYRYSLSGNSVFRFYGTSTYNEVYAVMPAMDIDMDTTELVFYGRCFYEKAAKVYTVSYLKGASTTYSQKLAVGTVTDPNDISTFVPIDTVEYGYTNEMLTTSTEVTNDPAGLRYFQKFTVPLTGAKGIHIAFRQVGYGYFYMDDVSLQKHQTARAPRDLELIDVTTNSATVSWKPMEQGGTYTLQYMVWKSAKNWDEATTVTGLTTTTYTIPNLELAQKYVWRVCHVDADVDATTKATSEYAFYEAFQTECETYTPNGFSTSFEQETGKVEYLFTSALYKNKCWSYLNQGTNATVGTSWAYNIPNTNSTAYSHSGNSALKLYHYSTTYQTVAVTPELDAEIGEVGKGFDTLQVSFYMSPCSRSISTGYLSSSSNTVAKMMEVGTCTDPEDPTTYTVLDTCIYKCDGNVIESNKVKGDETNEYGFQKFTVALNNATGPYVFFRANKNRTLDDGTVCTTSTVYVDDVVFETLQTCKAPSKTAVTDKTSTSAKISWSSDGAASFDIDVSTDATFLDSAKKVLSQTNMTDSSVVLDGLQKATAYYYRIKLYCDADRNEASEWTQTESFRTAFAPLFTETFTTNDLYMDNKGWQAKKGYAKDIFAGGQLAANTSSSDYNSWYRIQNNVINGYHLRMTFFYAGSAGVPTSLYQSETYRQKYWLITPLITVESTGARLLFDASLSTYEYSTSTKNQPIQVNEAWNTGWDDQFMIIVSEDGGSTWKRENAVIWNNETTNDDTDPHYLYGIGDYKLTDIDYEIHKMGIDLSKYAGKTIKIAFYGENTEQNANCALHIDNIRINYFVEEKQDLTCCQYQDIDDVLGFSVDGDTISSGKKKYERYALAAEDGVADSLYTLNAEIKEAPVYNYEITVCEGTPFEYMGFNEHSTPGTYRMKLTSQVTGCDSIVNLIIRHTQKFETTIDTTICEGDYVEFNGQQISTAGVHTAYLTSTLGGCDSIVTMRLSVTALKRSHTAVAICEGETYTFGRSVYDKSGVYNDTIHTTACDSIATLALTVRTNAHTTFIDSILHGESYVWGGQTLTEAATVDSTLTDVYGCDSVVTLNLLVKYANVNYQYGYICQGDSYEFGGNHYTATGTYYDTVRVSGQADVINGLVLTVYAPEHSDVIEAICAGETYTFGEQVLTESGQYTNTFANRYGCDSIVNLTLTVLHASTRQVAEQICKGDTYDFFGRLLSEAGTYTDTAHYVSGCDSVITILELTVLEPTTYEYSVGLCQGGSYIFGDTIITTAGDYTRTIANRIGCDSIITLHLTLNEPLRGSKYATFTKGCSYTYNGKTYTNAGEYEIDVLKTENGCDSIITLHLTEAEQGRDTVLATVCAGEYYIDDNFNTNIVGTHEVEIPMGECTIVRTLILANTDNRITKQAAICPGDTYVFYGQTLSTTGVYTETLQGQGEECDTIVTLNLTVLSGDTIYVQDSTTTAQLPYLYNGQVVLALGTPEGTYQDTLEISSASGECSQIVVLTITVRQSDAVDNVGYTSLRIRPTVVSRNEIVYIDNDFTAAQRAEMTIEMFDMLGHHIEVQIPETGAITISNFPCAGVYTILISTSEQTFIGRVIVKN